MKGDGIWNDLVLYTSEISDKDEDLVALRARMSDEEIERTLSKQVKVHIVEGRRQ